MAISVELPAWSYYSSQHGLLDERVRKVLEEPDGTLDVLTVDAGLFRFDGRNFLPHPANQQLQNLFIQNAFYDRHGVLWLACNYAGIWLHDHGRTTPAPFNNLFENQHFNALFEDPLGRIWIAVNRVGLFVWDGRNCSRVTEQFHLPLEDINDIQYFEGALYIWFASIGVFRIDLDHPDQPAVCLEKNNTLRFLFVTGVDRWLSISNQGELLSFYAGKSRSLHTIAPRQDLKCSILQDHQGNTWFSVNDSLFSLPADGQPVRNLPISYSGTLFLDHYHYLWLASNKGVARVRIPERKTYSLPSRVRDSAQDLSSFLTNRFFFAGEDGSRWSLDRSGRLLYFQNGRITPFHWPDSLAGCSWTAMTQDHNGHYWFASFPSRLLCWDGRTFTQPILPEALPAPYITTLFTDSRGTLWIGGVSAESIWGSARTDLLITGRTPGSRAADNRLLCALTIDSLGRVWSAMKSGWLFNSRKNELNKVEFTNAAPSLPSPRNLKIIDGALYGAADNRIFKITQNTDGSYSSQILSLTESASLPAAYAPYWPAGRFDHAADLERAMAAAFGIKPPANRLYNITSILQDSATLWIATSHTGLWRCSADSSFRIGPEQGCSSLHITQLIRTAKGVVYVATLDQGLFIYQQGVFKPVKCQPPLVSVTALAAGKGGTLHLGTSAGEVLTLSVNQAVIQHAQLAAGAVYALHELPGGPLAVALANGQFAIISQDSVRYYELDTLLQTPWLRQALAGQTISYPPEWTFLPRPYSCGIGAWDGNHLRLYTIADGLPGHEIIDIAESRDGRIFTATFNTGLAEYAHGRFVSVRDSLLDKMSRFIRLSAAPDSSLWALTEDQGAARLGEDRWQIWGRASPFISYNLNF